MTNFSDSERNELLSLIESSEDAVAIREICKDSGVPLFLCGGAIRDILSGYKVPTDLDLYVQCSEEKYNEIVKKLQENNVGKNPSREGGIFADLARCDDVQVLISNFDFTVNAIAFNLETLEVLEPLGRGVQDARDKLLYPTSNMIFLTSTGAHVRLFRIAYGKDLKISDELITLVRDNSELILLADGVGRCGIMAEFLDLLRVEALADALLQMTETRTLQKVLPEITPLLNFDKKQLTTLFTKVQDLHMDAEFGKEEEFLKPKLQRVAFDPKLKRKSILYHLSKVSLFRLSALLYLGFHALQSLDPVEERRGEDLVSNEALCNNYLNNFVRAYIFNNSLQQYIGFSGSVMKGAFYLKSNPNSPITSESEDLKKWAPVVSQLPLS